MLLNLKFIKILFLIVVTLNYKIFTCHQSCHLVLNLLYIGEHKWND